MLDPFGGVGSSALAALLLDRKAVSVERNENYIDDTIERVKAMASGTLRIRKLGTRVYVPSGKEKVSKIPESWLNYESDK